MRRPFIIGIGGTVRVGSSSERALVLSLAAAQAAGAKTLMLSGSDLELPLYNPGQTSRDAAAAKLVSLMRRCDGLIISSPSYHGGISGLVKNALDYAEDLRDDERPYLDGRAVGCVICAHGWQGIGSALTALRSVIHALRGWPTPMGAAVNTSGRVFDQEGRCTDEKASQQLDLVGRQVAEFARLSLQAPRPAPLPGPAREDGLDREIPLLRHVN